MNALDAILNELNQMRDQAVRLIKTVEFYKETVLELPFVLQPEQVDRLQTIKRAVSALFGIPVEELVGMKRPNQVTEARHMAFKLMREYTTAPLQAIGREFTSHNGNKKGMNHSSIKYGIASITNRCSVDPQLMNKLNNLRTVLNQKFQIKEKQAA